MLIERFRPILFMLCWLLAETGIIAQDTLTEAELKTVLRSIAHQTLLQSGDSNSRVLPLQRVDDSYIISFESEFAFTPDSIMEIFGREAERKGFPQHFLVEAIECDSEFVVHSFVINKLDQSDIKVCNERHLPVDCYQLKVTIVQKNFEIAEISTANQEDSYYWFLFILIPTLGMLILFIWWYNHRKTKMVMQNAHLIRIGQIQYDTLNTELLVDDQRFELTAKEGELLMLLYEKVNKTIKRDVILNRVWGDEGDYVGRTLDVFISKLRKKLEADSKVKIVNIRGVGYKMVVNN